MAHLDDLIGDLVKAQVEVPEDHQEPVYKNVTVRLQEDQIALFEALARALNKSRHEMIQTVLMSALYDAIELYNKRTGQALDVRGCYSKVMSEAQS